MKGDDLGSINFKHNLRDQPNLYSPNIFFTSVSGIASSVGLVHTGGKAKYESPFKLSISIPKVKDSFDFSFTRPVCYE